MTPSVLKILLIEDNPDDVFFIRTMLSDTVEDIIIEHFDRFEDGLAALKNGNIDIILLDLALPDSQGMDGLKVLQQKFSSLPIIVLTGLSDEHAGIIAVHEGAQDYLIKDQINSNFLIKAIRYAMERKHNEVMLKKFNDELQMKVEERTRELEDVNTALKVLLKQRENDKKELEEKIIANMQEVIMPCLEHLKKSRLDTKYRAYLDLLESNLIEITSPFMQSLTAKYYNLTYAEVQVVNFIKEGKSSKAIAELLDISIGTVDFHRNNIRKKLGLTNTKIGLRTHLLSLK